jgi:hypothetical protein
MLTQAPVSHHLDLYDYWFAKRGSRLMPARSDINPADIPTLLPYVMIVGKASDQFRYRLVGSAIARELGRDFTGAPVGSHVSDPKSASDVRAIYERAFTYVHPVFAIGKFLLASGAIHNVSLLVLPLSDDGKNVNMAVTTLVARFNPGLTARHNWLKGQPLKVCTVTDAGGAIDLKRLCLEWEQRCEASNL